MQEMYVPGQDQERFITDLRKGTALSHKTLEENFYSKAILSPSVSLTKYQIYLSGLYGINVACEQQIFPLISNLLPDVGNRVKTRLILDDLSVTEKTDFSSIPKYEFYPVSIPAAWGIMYVIEGSTLGGRILYKHIHEALGLTAESGASYFWGYGTATGNMWKTFMSVLAQFAVDNHCQGEIIESAIQTFKAIDEWLGEAAVHP